MNDNTNTKPKAILNLQSLEAIRQRSDINALRCAAQEALAIVDDPRDATKHYSNDTLDFALDTAWCDGVTSTGDGFTLGHEGDFTMARVSGNRWIIFENAKLRRVLKDLYYPQNDDDAGLLLMTAISALQNDTTPRGDRSPPEVIDAWKRLDAVQRYLDHE